MANQLTKQVMATIVARCDGYTPLKETSKAETSMRGQSKDSSVLNRREEALLSQIIHKKVQTEQPSPRETSTYQKPANLGKNGVVSLDALIRERKK